MKNRAGHYEKVSSDAGNYFVFTPCVLPPDPPIIIDEQMQAALVKANRCLGRLDGAVTTLPSADIFVYMYVRKEAVLSSQIEGTQSSLQDLLAAEAEISDPDRPKDVEEVVNYVNAMNFGLQRLNELPVSTRLIREIHSRLLVGVRGGNRDPGNLRTAQNWIGPSGASIREASFVPPAPNSVGDHLSALEKFLHDRNDRTPTLLKIGLAHAQFETIHPFLDGNGRMGRLLITFLLLEAGILSKPVLYLSHYFKANRQQYYQELQAIRDEGSWEAWLLFFLRGIIKVSEEATDTARDILQMRELHRTQIQDNLGGSAGPGQRLLDHLYKRPWVSVKDVESLNACSYTAANNLVKEFERLGYLHESTGYQRNRQFLYLPYVELFSSNPP